MSAKKVLGGKDDELDPKNQKGQDLRDLIDKLKRYKPEEKRLEPQTYENWKKNVKGEKPWMPRDR